jgi:hypothetical protein
MRICANVYCLLDNDLRKDIKSIEELALVGEGCKPKKKRVKWGFSTTVPCVMEFASVFGV